MTEGVDSLYFTGKNRFLAEIALQEDQNNDQRAIGAFIRDTLREPIRGILVLQRTISRTPGVIESVIFADLRMNDPISEQIIETVTEADALLEKRLNPPLRSAISFVNTLGLTPQNVRFNLWSRSQVANSRIVVGAVFT